MLRISSEKGKAIISILLLTLLMTIACGGGGNGTSEPVSTLTPTPIDTSTPSPAKSPTSEQTLTPDEIETPAKTPVSTVSPTPSPVDTPVATPVPIITPELTVEITPTSTESPEPEETPQVCSFKGYVAIDDASVPDGTVISAWIDNELVGSAATKGSTYQMIISGEYSGKMVSFKIGSDKATQTSVWERGADVVLGLSVRLGPPVCRFYGTVTDPRGNVPDDTLVSALVDGTTVGSTTITGSWYDLTLPGEYSGRTVRFKVGADQAQETSIWERGGSININLTVVLP